MTDEERERALASIIQRLLPSPWEGVPRGAKFHEELMTELRGKLGLPAGDESQSAREQLLDAARAEMAALVLAGPRKEGARARSADRGELPPLDHLVVFADNVLLRGVKRDEVYDALRKPTDVTRIRPHPDYRGPSNTMMVSRVFRGPDPFTLIVQANRDGAQLTIQAAFRVYHSEVPEAATLSAAIDVLKAFLRKYGVPISIGGGEAKLLHEYETVAADKFQVIPGKAVPFAETSIVLRKNVDQSFEVVWAFSFDAPRYDIDLKRHGIMVQRPKS